jgi:serine/threonine protein kinase
MAIVQDWIEGDTLGQILSGRKDRSIATADMLTFMGLLISLVEALHGREFTHRDIKPANIVVSAGAEPFLINALDFSPASDGERLSTTYARETGSRYERNRFALTKLPRSVDRHGVRPRSAR